MNNLIQTGIIMKRRICENCGESTFELGGLYD